MLPGNWNHSSTRSRLAALRIFAGSLMRSDGRAALAGFGILVGALVDTTRPGNCLRFRAYLHMTAFWGVTAIVAAILGAAGLCATSGV